MTLNTVILKTRNKLCYRKRAQRHIHIALLSQRGRAMLRVIEYFAKSLKITQGHSK